MKQYKAHVSGRFTYKEDWENVQELALSVSKIFEGCEDFIISGCEISGNVGNKTIAEGYIWMDKKIRFFEGKTGIDLASTNYLIANLTTETVKYVDNVIQVGVENYNVIWGDTIPTVGTSYITIPATGVLPNINEEFFGKYAILSNTTASKQTLKQMLHILSDLIVEKGISVGGQTSKAPINVSRVDDIGKTSKITTSVAADGTGSISHYYDDIKVGEVQFNPIEKKFIININSEEKLSLDEDGVHIKNTYIDGFITNGIINISEGGINVSEGDNDNVELELNKVGYNNGITKFRNLAIYNGRGAKGVEYIGSTNTVNIYGSTNHKTGDNDDIFITHSNKAKTDNTLKKAITWRDNANNIMFRIGYLSDQDGNISLDNTAVGDIELKPKNFLKVSTQIQEQGELLSSKYADKITTENAIDNRVVKIIGKGLSEEDFTTALKNKLTAISSGSVANGSDGYITGNQVFEVTNDKVVKTENLADLSSASAARYNLSVFSKEEANNSYSKKSSNLSDLTNVTSARENLNVYAKTEVYKRSETYGKDDVFSKEQSDIKYALAPKDTVAGAELRANTYFEVPGGMFMQIFSFTSYKDGDQTVPFPKDFPNGCMHVMFGSNVFNTPTNITKNSFTVDRWNDVDGSQETTVMALGW